LFASSARVFGNRILDPLVVGKVITLPHVKASANSAVNCLAFGRQSSGGYRWLYSGHYDGTITKWDCESMATVWTARAYGNDRNGQQTSFCGVTHLIVNSPGTQIFCFTNSNAVMSFSGEVFACQNALTPCACFDDVLSVSLLFLQPQMAVFCQDVM
jgi:hypothetical protein